MVGTSMNCVSDGSKDETLSVAIFGLSANPPTGDEGHRGIVRHLVDTGSFREIWILPVYQHIFAGKRSLEGYEHRLAMCQLCFCPLSSETCRVKVLPLEREAYDIACADREASCDHRLTELPPLRLGTIDIIEYIQSSRFYQRENNRTGVCDVGSREKYSDIHLVLGTDTFRDLMTGKWKRAESIISKATLEVFQRVGTVSSQEIPRNVELLQNAVVNDHFVAALGSVSSTAIRSWNPPVFQEICDSFLDSVLKLLSFKSSEPLLSSNDIHPDVYNYIKREELYFFSPEAKKKRLHEFLFSVSTVVAAVAAVCASAAIMTRRRK